jgi:hypothetical protein
MLSVLLHFELKSELRKSEASSAEKDVSDAAKDM